MSKRPVEFGEYAATASFSPAIPALEIKKPRHFGTAFMVISLFVLAGIAGVVAGRLLARTTITYPGNPRVATFGSASTLLHKTQSAKLQATGSAFKEKPASTIQNTSQLFTNHPLNEQGNLIPTVTGSYLQGTTN